MQPSIIKYDKVLLVKTASSLKAIAHPVRLAIIDLLRDGKRLNVTQIHKALGTEQAVTSQHLGILKEKDVLGSKRQGKHAYYFLKHPTLLDVIQTIMSTYES
ncbi:MAG: metalloregulator ArsR/SmtB family transcription factor [Bacteroidia bacterium]|jgi:DNA-binding transcriptional ArsR family regulator|nr:metalloregulator ArsR/SmtB family transcription factor [Bacteroidia bacterium]